MCRDTWKVIQSLQLLVSHQMRPTSSVRALCGLSYSYSCFTGTWVLGQFGGNWARIPQTICRNTLKVIQSLQFLISHQMRPCSSVRALCGLGYTCFTGIWVIWGKLGLNTQIMCRDMWKVIQSLQLLDSHQMRPYSSVRVLCGSSYTCFTGTRVLGQFGETGLEYPKSCAGIHEK